MISVKPDPAHPRGGYAELSMSEASLAGDTTEVAVFDNYSERFLGESGWQPTKVLFGPYQILREGDVARLIIGPEIVNQIEEYANVKLLVGESESDVSWPDEVVPAPGAAKIGGIMGASLKEQAPKVGLQAKLPDPEPEPEPDPAPHDSDGEDTSNLSGTISTGVDDADTPAKSKMGLFIGLFLLVLAAGGLAWWLLNAEDTPPTEPIAEPVVEPAPPVATADPCAIEQLSALSGFPAQAEALRGCAGQASADAALGLVERAAAAGDAGALALFGTVYDSAVTDAVIEEQIGLTFGDEPATAAEYYARAVAAGSTEAADNLAALCTRMAVMTDTLVQGAVADYCGSE